jgi:DNA-binding CsgD family transcriptional regulator
MRRASSTRGACDAPLPDWIRILESPVWVTDPEGRLIFLNEQAGALLGLGGEPWRGRPCHRVVGARDEAGRPFCREVCSVRERVRVGGSPRPVLLEVGREPPRWVHVLVIPVHPPRGGETALVHCALPADRLRRAERYLARVASRSGPRSGPAELRATPSLTSREREVLGLLTADEDLHRISARLHISYHTVRNHVRHILEKLDVHSVPEAVALHLLTVEQLPDE